MKKFTFTVAQILFLQKVRESIGYSSDNVLDLLDEDEDPTIDVVFELSESDIEDIADSIQQYIESEDIPEEELATANKIFILLGVLLPEEVAEQQEDVVAGETTEEVDSEQDEEEYSPNPD